jgi:hypothetical protein
VILDTPPQPRTLAHLLCALLLATTAACASQPAAPVASTGGKATTAAPPVTTRITAFSVSNENLNVDIVGLRDGLLKPDGARDLAFTATVEGPFNGLFVVSCNAKGEPSYGLRADTLRSNEDIPTELAGVVDTGKMTVPMGVVEGGKFINGESGSAEAGAGVHQLKLYTPNTATLRAGSFVRLYARVEGGTLVPGPVAPY